MPFCCFKSIVLRLRFDFFCKYIGFVDKKQEKRGIKKGYIILIIRDMMRYNTFCQKNNIPFCMIYAIVLR